MENEPKNKEKILGQLESNDPFQSKLDEIDRELRKFEDVSGENTDEKCGKFDLRSLSARNCFLVSAVVDLGPSKSDMSNLKNNGPLHVPIDPTLGSAGPTQNSYSPNPLDLSSPKPRIPSQDISNGDGQESEIKSRKVRIKARNNTESQTLSKNVPSLEPLTKCLLPVVPNIPISK